MNMEMLVLKRLNGMRSNLNELESRSDAERGCEQGPVQRLVQRLRSHIGHAYPAPKGTHD